MRVVAPVKVVAVVTAIDAEVPETGVAETVLPHLLEHELIDEVIVAVPHGDLRVGQFVQDQKFNVFFGSEDDVALRILQAMDRYPDETIIARFMLRAFWIDRDFVAKTIKQLAESEADFALYPSNVNYTFGCDAFTLSALRKAYLEIESLPSKSSNRASYLFSPWSFFEGRSEFRPTIVKWAETYRPAKVKSLRHRYSMALGSGENSHGSSALRPAARYLWAQTQLAGSKRVLDFSSGTGGGTQYLSSFCEEIIGLEPDPAYVLSARELYPNPTFLQGDSSLLSLMPQKFDAIVSLHTLEHVDDDMGTLLDLRKSLSDSGRLIIEVPLLLEIPLGEPLLPFHDREYAVQDFLELLRRAGFRVIEAFGVSRNAYRELEFAREAVAVVAEKASGFKGAHLI